MPAPVLGEQHLAWEMGKHWGAAGKPWQRSSTCAFSLDQLCGSPDKMGNTVILVMHSNSWFAPPNMRRNTNLPVEPYISSQGLAMYSHSACNIYFSSFTSQKFLMLLSILKMWKWFCRKTGTALTIPWAGTPFSLHPSKVLSRHFLLPYHIFTESSIRKSHVYSIW